MSSGTPAADSCLCTGLKNLLPRRKISLQRLLPRLSSAVVFLLHVRSVIYDLTRDRLPARSVRWVRSNLSLRALRSGCAPPAAQNEGDAMWIFGIISFPLSAKA